MENCFMKKLLEYVLLKLFNIYFDKMIWISIYFWVMVVIIGVLKVKFFFRYGIIFYLILEM